MLLHELEKYTEQLLQIDRFKDYAPNGLQVEGRATVQRVACGVTASEALIDAAIEWHADALIVHHGYFWRGEDARILGQKRKRLAKLLGHHISLLAYHLPLDAHPEFGNNAQLGRRLGLIGEGLFGEQDLGWIGRPEADITAGGLAARIGAALGREPVVVGDAQRPLARVAWCTGGAQRYFEDAVAAGCDCFITGEASEHNYHLAVESGVAFIAAGHYATERYGVRALTAHLGERFGLATQFFEEDNPF